MVFYGADGRPWFRLDDRRRDVPLAADLSLISSRPWSRPRIAASGGIRASIRWAWPRAVLVNLRRLRHGRGRLDDHAAACADAVPVERPHRRAQGQEAVDHGDARDAPDEGADSRALPESRVSQRRALRRRGDVDGPFRQARQRRDASPRRRSSPASCRRRRRSRRGRISMARGAAATLVLRRMQAAGFITQAQANAARRQRLRIRPYPVAGRGAARLREGVSAPAVPEPVRRRSSRRLGGPHDAAAGAAGRRRAGGGVRPAAPRHPNLQAALVAIDADTGHVLAVVGGSDFTTTHVQSGGAQPPPAGFGLQAVLVRGGARTRVQPGHRAPRPRGAAATGPRGMDAAQRLGRDRGSADAARGVHRVEQPRRRRAAAADWRPARSSAWRRAWASSRSPTCRRWPSGRAW